MNDPFDLEFSTVADVYVFDNSSDTFGSFTRSP